MSTTNNENQALNGDNNVAKTKFTHLKHSELIRGSSPKDIENRCLQLCKRYIGDVWLEAKTKDDINVKRISGGLTNQLYLVHLQLDNDKHCSKVPKEVTIKIYQKKNEFFVDDEEGIKENEHFSDSLVSMVTSMIGVGPKVYGLFGDGIIQAYYKHEQFRKQHHGKLELVRQLAEHLAMIHNVDIPLPKPQGNPHLQAIKMRIDSAYRMHDMPKFIQELKLESLRQKPLMEEFKELEEIINAVESSMVFCHNDYRGSNLLVTQDGTKIVVCDYDYSGYGPRAFDFASLFYEWNKEIFDFDNLNLPPDETLNIFIEYYIKKMEQLQPNYSDDPKNGLEVIKREVKLYILVNLFFFICLIGNLTDSIVLTMVYDEAKNVQRMNFLYEKYFKFKETLIEDGTIKI